MRRGTRTVAAAVAVMAVITAACAQDDEPGATPPPTELELSLKIGHLAPLSGDLSDFGPPISRAAELAAEFVEEEAAKAGVAIDISIVTEDDQTDAQAGVEAARKLVDADDVDVILGAAASSVTIAVANAVTIPGEVVQISCCSTSGDITKLDDDGFVNRTPPSDEHQAPILAKAVADAFGADATVNVGARNDAYGNFIINQTSDELEKLGLTVGEPVLWDPKAATFDSEAQQIVSGDPDGWVLVDFPATWQKMSAALVRTGDWDPAKTFTADGLKTPNLPLAPPTGSGQQATEGMRGTAPGGTQTFDDLWIDRVGDEVGRGAFDSHGFDGVVIAALAAIKAKSADSTAIRDNLREVTGPGGTKYTFEQLAQAITDLLDGKDIDYEGASGPINLDENGDPQSVGAIYDLWSITDGKVTTDEVFVVPQ